MAETAAPEELDVLFVGAGISGIDGAWHLQKRCPGKSYAILEARERIGGTWDLFRYPGIRSDSDMYTLGFPFRPWTGEKSIADGGDIRDYVEETAREFGINHNIRLRHRVTKAAWSSAEARWTIEAEAPDGPKRYRARFLYLGSGYYDYERGYRPEWPGEGDYEGVVIHPQFWPENLDHAGKRIVVIGSGATAVTLVPALAETAAHVTMLQRSPSWIVARPSEDGIARRLQRLLPARAAARTIRWKNVLLGMLFFQRSRKAPERVRALLLKWIAEQLPGRDIEKDFVPTYNPWDQRVCLVPDGDLFRAIREDRVTVVTDTIERFTSDGVRLGSGEELPADIIVTATGLIVKVLGGIAITVDGAPLNPAEHVNYKGMMLSDVPNLVLSFGYTNASWTLKCDLTARYFCRLVHHMDTHGLDYCVPRLPVEGVEREPMLDFSSGYVQRAAGSLPEQGLKPPWRVHQNYFRDVAALGLGTVTDGVMEFRKAG
jgi:cation diffusion facilitator CzcD-associated flavoprotein CzcO